MKRLDETDEDRNGLEIGNRLPLTGSIRKDRARES